MFWKKRIEKKTKDWTSITLEMAQELEQLTPDMFEDEIEYTIERLSILEDRDSKELENETVFDLIQKISEYKFLTVLPEKKFIPSFVLNGTRYGIQELTSLTLGQMIDIEEYYKMGFMENAHIIFSILFRETKSYNHITKKYTLIDYEFSEERASAFKKAPMDIFYSNMLFFWSIVQEYLKDMVDSSITQNQEKMMSILTKMEEELSEMHKNNNKKKI